jgi:hypothetical protein
MSDKRYYVNSFIFQVEAFLYAYLSHWSIECMEMLPNHLALCSLVREIVVESE